MSAPSITKSNLGNLDYLPPELQNEAASFLHPAELACVSKKGLQLSLERYRDVATEYYEKYEKVDSTFKIVSEIFQFNRIQPGRYYYQKIVKRVVRFVMSLLPIRPALPYSVEGPVFNENVNSGQREQNKALILFYQGLFDSSSFPNRDNIPWPDILDDHQTDEDYSNDAFIIRQWMAKNANLFEDIKTLELTDEHMVAIPSEISYFKNATSLNLRSNQILHIGEGIKNLKNLTEINLSSNGMERIPDPIFEIGSLEILDLADNAFEHLPNEICKLPKLRSLYTENNLFKSPPPQIAEIPTLKILTTDFVDSYSSAAGIKSLLHPDVEKEGCEIRSGDTISYDRVVIKSGKFGRYYSDDSLKEQTAPEALEDNSNLNLSTRNSNSPSSSSSLLASGSSSTIAGSERVPLEDTDVVMEIAPPITAFTVPLSSQEPNPHLTENQDPLLPVSKKRKR